MTLATALLSAAAVVAVIAPPASAATSTTQTITTSKGRVVIKITDAASAGVTITAVRTAAGVPPRYTVKLPAGWSLRAGA